MSGNEMVLDVLIVLAIISMAIAFGVAATAH